MKTKGFWAIALALLGLVWGALPVYANPVPIYDLIARASDWDNRQVEIRGEAIGDIMQRGDKAWLNVGDQGVAIGIWGDAEQLKKIKYTGDYGQVGDTILVTGEFHAACPEHGGDMDIHVEQIEVIQEGHPVAHPVSQKRFTIAAVGFSLALSLGIIAWQRNKERNVKDML